MIDLSLISYYQWTALVGGILYMVFAATGKKICWIFLLVSTLCIALEDIYHLHLYFDAILQFFYAILACTNLWLWYQQGPAKGTPGTLRISSLDIARNIAYFAVVLVIAIPTGYFFRWNTELTYSFMDSVKSLLAVLATFLLIYKILDTWYYWLVVNLISLYLFIMTGAYAIALLYTFYLLASLRLFYQWFQEYKQQALTTKI